MITHVILFKPRPELTAGERDGLLKTLEGAAAGIPSIRRIRLGARVRHGRPGYEQMMKEDFEYAVIIEFDDLQALGAYLAHPQHAAIGKHFSESAAAALAYDYEMVDL
jgi:stress responsive alpha/beta barrel protein